MTRPRTAIVAALPREVGALVRGVRPDRSLTGEGIFLYELPTAVVVCAGMGAARAAIAVEHALQRGPVATLVSTGLAGGCDPALPVGSVLELGEVVDALTGERFAASVRGPVLVTTHTIAGVAEKKRLHDSYGAALVDMEAATVARLAQMRDLPFRAIKAVSDAHDFELGSLSRFASPHGHFRTGAFALHTALRPRTWRKTIQLGAGSNRALTALTASLLDAIHRPQ